MTTLALPGSASQATQIEQARAVAEVAAAIRYAQDNPRDEDRALAMFERSCQRIDFAQRAFFRYSRGGQQVTGPTIAFAQEAARCWQNMQSGTAELSRRATESEMVAFAWDLEMNTQRRTTFVNPHTGYTDTPKPDKPARALVAVRDVRENNQSAGSRVEREMILAVLPTWYVEMGKAWCVGTLAGQGGGKPIEERRRELVKRFEQLGVRRDDLIAKLGIPVDQWIEADLATLIVIGQSLKNGETTVEAEFRTTPEPATAAATSVTGAAITRRQTAQDPAPAADPSAPTSEGPAADDGAQGRARRRMQALFTKAGVTREEKLTIVELFTERAVGSTNDLTAAEVDTVVGRLAAVERTPGLKTAAEGWLQDYAQVADEAADPQDGEQ